jgi:hypothetical protein
MIVTNAAENDATCVALREAGVRVVPAASAIFDG